MNIFIINYMEFIVIQISINNCNESIFYNDSDINELKQFINNSINLIKYNTELKVKIFNNQTSDSHQYQYIFFDNYDLKPKKWLLNNILNSFYCEDTEKDMCGLLDVIANKFKSAFNNI